MESQHRDEARPPELRTQRRLTFALAIAAAAVVHFPSPAFGQSVDPSTEAIEADAAVDADRLRSGDLITLTFEKEPLYNGDFTVAGDGSVMLPLIGLQQVADAPADAVQVRLAQAYGERLRNQHVQIQLKRRVRVFGGVNRPGLYHVDTSMTLGDAIAEAGGVKQGAKMRGIKIIRGSTELEANLLGDDLIDPYLFSGDQIMVPEGSSIILTGLKMVGTAALTALTWQIGRRAIR